jgi:hypothetical protein
MVGDRSCSADVYHRQAIRVAPMIIVGRPTIKVGPTESVMAAFLTRKVSSAIGRAMLALLQIISRP